MTEIEKITRHDTLAILRQRIGSSFGTADCIFAGHELDKKRAREFRELAFETGITLAEIRELSLDFLYTKGCNGDHIKEQVEKVSKFFGKKIS
jgi:hypothetical protein